jgi:hypothetical protein
MATFPTDQATDFRERVRNYELNRGSIPRELLLPFLGKWVAISLDGKRVVASADRLADLEGILRAQEMDPQEVFFEKIADNENAIDIDFA